MSPQWHYIIHEKLGNDLYDWKNDPREVHNLADRPDVQGVVARFRAELL